MDDNDVDILVPPRDEEEEELIDELHAKEVTSTLIKIGITQIVLGIILIIGGVIIICSWPDPGIDRVAEGIWSGVFVITCLVMNALSSLLLLSGMVMAGISTVQNSLKTSYRHEEAIGFMMAYSTLNAILIGCFVLSLYLSMIYGKILAQKRDNCCSCFNQESHHNYSMAYFSPIQYGPEYMKVHAAGSVDPQTNAPVRITDSR